LDLAQLPEFPDSIARLPDYPITRFSCRGRWASLLLVTALTVAARLPFLIRGDQFFDSDEAVEGLMARHVGLGELPVFMWGQSYKGVPEVYVAAAAFTVAGASVVALKATTLLFFTAFVACYFVLIDELLSRRVAWLASLFLILCPPVLVHWSLSGSAEIAITLLTGTVLMLAAERWRQTRALGALAVACVAVGFGLWVQQFIVYYLVALAAVMLRPGSGSRRWGPLRLFLGLSVIYGLLGVVAFFTAGFDLPAGIGVHHPQKLWRLAGVFLAIWAAGRWLETLTNRERIVAVAGFAIGYGPALAFRLRAAGGGLPPLSRADIHSLPGIIGLTMRGMLPMIAGFAGPTSDLLPVPKALAILMVVTIALSYAAPKHARATRIFHIFLVSTPLIVLASGSYSDVQRYRYLMPIFAALPAIYATGVEAAWDWHRAAGVALGGALLATFAVQQLVWSRTLGPDRESRAVLACLNQQGVDRAYADYWLSYKLTFLSGETIIVAPSDGLDRYPAYTALVRAADHAPTIVRPPGPDPEVVPCNRVLSFN
jgi:hypothetical protein